MSNSVSPKISPTNLIPLLQRNVFYTEYVQGKNVEQTLDKQGVVKNLSASITQVLSQLPIIYKAYKANDKEELEGGNEQNISILIALFLNYSDELKKIRNLVNMETKKFSSDIQIDIFKWVFCTLNNINHEAITAALAPFGEELEQYKFVDKNLRKQAATVVQEQKNECQTPGGIGKRSFSSYLKKYIESYSTPKNNNQDDSDIIPTMLLSISNWSIAAKDIYRLAREQNFQPEKEQKDEENTSTIQTNLALVKDEIIGDECDDGIEMSKNGDEYSISKTNNTISPLYIEQGLPTQPNQPCKKNFDYCFGCYLLGIMLLCGGIGAGIGICLSNTEKAMIEEKALMGAGFGLAVGVLVIVGLYLYYKSNQQSFHQSQQNTLPLKH